MGNTYTQISIHVVFWLHDNFIEECHHETIYKYISGIVKNSGHKTLAVGGTRDHIHILFGLNPDQAVSALVRDIKSNSTRFIKEKHFVKGAFNWQAGFGGFSYSKSQRIRVINYILNQKKHHMKVTFREEYEQMLKDFEIEYDKKYII